MKTKLQNFINSNSAVAKVNHAEKIRVFAWFLHFVQKKDRFVAADIKRCYQALDMESPTNISPFLSQMEKTSPKQALRDVRGWYLEHRLMQTLTTKYGEREITIQVSQLLQTLPSKVPDHAEREFLEETLICYRRGAFRAAVVMAWNLTYWHLCQHILRQKLSEFNDTYPIRLAGKWQKSKVQQIVDFDDFSAELRESEVLEIAKAALIVTNDVYKILHHALGKRNSAAHPSSTKIEQLQAEALIDDLVKNVVLVLTL